MRSLEKNLVVLSYHWLELLLCFLAVSLCVAVFAQMAGEHFI